LPNESENAPLFRDNPNERFFPEVAPDKRTNAERDRDRVLYSSQFARLAEITQVISPEQGYVFHNRLTHSLKVAQIGRRIAQRIQEENDTASISLRDLPDVVEAAALAHDLGHPPFGHVAEVELDKLVRGAGLRDGCEGNAQSFRILTRLAASDALTIENAGTTDEYEDSVRGLNWTRQCLDSVLKYPWGHAENSEHAKKWGFYESEREIFGWVRQGKTAPTRSLGAEIMDWADDITYAIHDLLDFFRSGSIPIDRMGDRSMESIEFLEGAFQRNPEWRKVKDTYVKALSFLVSAFPFTPQHRYRDSLDDHMSLQNFSTGLIRSLVDAIRYVPSSSSGSVVDIRPEARRQVDLMKQFTWHYIILNRDLALPQSGQRRAIRTVFRKLLLAARKPKPDYHLFPASIRDNFKNVGTEKFFHGGKNAEVRVVADYIASLTEKEVMRVFRALEGTV
jgi:dGTPase